MPSQSPQVVWVIIATYNEAPVIALSLWMMSRTMVRLTLQGYVRDTCNFSPQQVLSRKVSFLGQPIGTTFGVENQ